MRNSKILLITSIFPPEIGGPATFIDKLAIVLSEKGHDVCVICASPLSPGQKELERPFRIRRVTASNRILFYFKLFPVLLVEMARHARILVNGLEYQVYLASRITRKEYVLKIVGDTVWETAISQGDTILNIDDFQKDNITTNPHLLVLKDRRKKYLSKATSVITPSNYLARLVGEWGIDRERIKIILNGIELEKFRNDVSKAHDGSHLNIAFVGRLTSWKGVETILLAIKSVDDVTLHVIGSGPERAMLANITSQLDIKDKVMFHGKVSSDKVHELIKTCDALVLVSSYEGLSHTLLEACASGVPCITSDRGGNPEVIIDNYNGFVIPYGNPAALAAAIEKLRDISLGNKLATGARESASRFDFNNTVKETIELLLKDER